LFRGFRAVPGRLQKRAGGFQTFNVLRCERPNGAFSLQALANSGIARTGHCKAMELELETQQNGNELSSLKENADVFADCHGLADEQTVDAREERDEHPGRSDSEEKTRKCLVCRSPFPSAWAGERICRRCKSTSAWRSGALG
jgi:hypothetical protein